MGHQLLHPGILRDQNLRLALARLKPRRVAPRPAVLNRANFNDDGLRAPHGLQSGLQFIARAVALQAGLAHSQRQMSCAFFHALALHRQLLHQATDGLRIKQLLDDLDPGLMVRIGLDCGDARIQARAARALLPDRHGHERGGQFGLGRSDGGGDGGRDRCGCHGWYFSQVRHISRY